MITLAFFIAMAGAACGVAIHALWTERKHYYSK